MTDNTLLSTVENGVATMTLNRPEAMNALTPGMIDAALETLKGWSQDPTIKVVVITGAGKAFTAGVDLKSLNKITPVNGLISGEIDKPGQALTALMATMPQPVIAKINGYCFTGGLELALACDMLYCANEAKLGDTHAKWGIRPSWGMTQRLPRRVGQQMAKEMSFTARFVGGEEAERIGLVNRAVPLAELDALVDSITADICGNSSETVAALKDLYNSTDGMELGEGMQYEYETGYSISDTAERLKAFIE